ncbi:hypothetical protein SRHO_G00247540 [Serrasalmus rhombeus]
MDSEGLVSVSSWLLFSPSESEWISCSVGSSDQETREGRVLLFKPATATAEPGVSPGWRAFTILRVISLLVFTAMTVINPKIRGLIFPFFPKSLHQKKSRHLLLIQNQKVNTGTNEEKDAEINAEKGQQGKCSGEKK